MNKSVVVGYKEIVSKKSGDKFVELHLVTDDPYITGQRVESAFVRADNIQNLDILDVGCNCIVYYNRFGRAEGASLSID